MQMPNGLKALKDMVLVLDWLNLVFVFFRNLVYIGKERDDVMCLLDWLNLGFVIF